MELCVPRFAVIIRNNTCSYKISINGSIRMRHFIDLSQDDNAKVAMMEAKAHVTARIVKNQWYSNGQLW
jgi:hypothetical protein